MSKQCRRDTVDEQYRGHDRAMIGAIIGAIMAGIIVKTWPKPDGFGSL